jgi:anti-sigma regulatory factor (Ser/Thr protein kinase)
MSREDGWQMKLPAAAENIAVIRTEVSARAALLGMSENAIDDLRTIVSEACSNVVKYAYDGDLKGPLEVELHPDGEHVNLYVRDRGGGVRPRPSSGTPSLKLGLLLIGALSRRFSLCSEAGAGTELKVVMALHPQHA